MTTTMTIDQIRGHIESGYVDDRAADLIEMAELAPEEGEALVEACLEETDANGERVRGQVSHDRIAEAESALEAAARRLGWSGDDA